MSGRWTVWFAESYAYKVNKPLATGLLQCPLRNLGSGDAADGEEARHREEVHDVEAEQGRNDCDGFPGEAEAGKHH
jgi:hypothetical protein